MLLFSAELYEMLFPFHTGVSTGYEVHDIFQGAVALVHTYRLQR